jgi:hypothetical protein
MRHRRISTGYARSVDGASGTRISAGMVPLAFANLIGR